MTRSFEFIGIVLSTFLLLSLVSEASLIIDDDLINWDNRWACSLDGVTASADRYSSAIDGSYIAFRVSNCPDDDSSCFQSELSNSSSMDIEGQYWFGFSVRLHDLWRLRLTGLRIVAKICGNSALDSTAMVCVEQDVGPPAPGSWDHWVVHDAFSQAGGDVTVWRNGIVVCSAVNVLTTFQNTQKPVVSIGLYVESWDSKAKAATWANTGLVEWLEMHFRRVKVGGASSSYDEAYTGGAADFTRGSEVTGVVTLAEALLRDVMPPSSPLCKGGGRTSFSFDYTSTYNISRWDDMNRDFEDDVFLAELRHEDADRNKSWAARVAPGGNIYSYIHGVMGELMPVQHHEDAPFNDEVWQIVMVDAALHDATAFVNGMNRRYFIHQAGPYQRDADSDLRERPFVSPSLAKHCEGRECLFCGWGQQAHVPTRQTSDALYYTRFKDCGDGVMEQTWIVHNNNPAGKDRFTYTNVPWAAVRTSQLMDAFLARVDGTGMDLIEPLLGFGVEYRPNLEDIGGYTTFAQDVPFTSTAFSLPCGDGTGIDVPCSHPSAQQVSLTIRGANTAKASPAHTAAWGRYTVVVDIEATVRHHVACQSGCYFRATTPRGSYVDLKGVMRWASGGRLWFMWPITDTEVEVNAKFLAGDVITVTRLDDGRPADQNLALSWVYGTNEEYKVQFNQQGRRSWVTGKDRVRIGQVGTVYDRDLTVFTVNVFMEVVPGNTFYYRQYLLPGTLTKAHAEASKWVPEARKGMREPGDMPGSTVMLFSTDGSVFGAGIQEACAPIRCNGSTTPQPNTSALFAITCGPLNYVGHDLYHFAPNHTDVSKPVQPYICNDQIPIRPTWQLLGYFSEGACDFVADALYRADLCSAESLSPSGLSYFFRPFVDKDRKKDLQAREDCSLLDAEQPHLQVPLAASTGQAALREVLFRGSHGAYGSAELAVRAVQAPEEQYPPGPLDSRFERANVFVSGGAVGGAASYHSWNQRLYSAAMYEDLLLTYSSGVGGGGEAAALPSYEAVVQLTTNSSFPTSPIPQVMQHLSFIAGALGFNLRVVKWCD